MRSRPGGGELEDRLVLAAGLGRALVGHVVALDQAADRPGGEGEISLIQVADRHRGQGVGAALLRAAAGRLLTRGPAR